MENPGMHDGYQIINLRGKRQFGAKPRAQNSTSRHLGSAKSAVWIQLICENSVKFQLLASHQMNVSIHKCKHTEKKKVQDSANKTSGRVSEKKSSWVDHQHRLLLNKASLLDLTRKEGSWDFWEDN